MGTQGFRDQSFLGTKCLFLGEVNKCLVTLESSTQVQLHEAEFIGAPCRSTGAQNWLSAEKLTPAQSRLNPWHSLSILQPASPKYSPAQPSFPAYVTLDGGL